MAVSMSFVLHLQKDNSSILTRLSVNGVRLGDTLNFAIKRWGQPKYQAGGSYYFDSDLRCSIVHGKVRVLIGRQLSLHHRSSVTPEDLVSQLGNPEPMPSNVELDGKQMVFLSRNEEEPWNLKVDWDKKNAVTLVILAFKDAAPLGYDH